MPHPPRPAMLTAAWLPPTLVIIQAALTGQTWFAGAGLTGLHGGIGHAVLLVTGATTLVSWAIRAPRPIAITFTTLLALVIAQIGLGYSGHRAAVATASAIHVPLGVTIAIVASVAATALTSWLRTNANGV